MTSQYDGGLERREDTSSTRNDRAEGVHEGAQGLSVAVERRALLAARDEGLDGRQQLAERRGNRAEARSKLGLEALHDLSQLGEHAVEGGADGASSETTTTSEAIECTLQLGGNLAHVARGHRLGH